MLFSLSTSYLRLIAAIIQFVSIILTRLAHRKTKYPHPFRVLFITILIFIVVVVFVSSFPRSILIDSLTFTKFHMNYRAGISRNAS